MKHINLFGEVGTDIRLVNLTSKLTGSDDLTIHLNSEGGEVSEGMAIYNTLMAYPGKKIVRVEGLAASIASLIAMAGDRIEILKGAFFMVHKPFAMAGGNANELRSTAEILDKMGKDLIDIYSKRTKKSPDDIEALLDAETWMNADESVANGFADAVVSAGKPKAQRTWNLSAFARVPKALLANGAQQPINKETSMDEETKKVLDDMAESLKKHKADMDDALKAVKARLDEMDKKMKADDDDGDGDDDGDDDGDGDGDKKPDAKAQATLKALALANGEIAKLKAAVEAQAKKGFEAKVSEAIKAGKLMPALKAWALGVGEESFDAYLTGVGDAKVLDLGKEHQEGNPPVAASGTTKAGKKILAAMGVSEEDLKASYTKRPKGQSLAFTLGADEGE